MATQHCKDRIRCNAIAPGAIVTPHTRGVAGPLFDMIARHMPMGELGPPEDAAALVAFLAADESRSINGEIIVLDGGMMAHNDHVRDMWEWNLEAGQQKGQLWQLCPSSFHSIAGGTGS